MIEKIIVIALIITAIHVSLYDGMIFGKLKVHISNALDKMHVPVLKRPLYECNICMGGIWTLIIYPILFGIDWQIIPVMLGVIGANVLIAAVIKYLYNDSI